MATQELTVSDFHSGKLSDETVQVEGHSVMVGVDLTSKDGYVGAAPGVTAMTEAAATNNITSTIHWIKKFGTSWYALGGGPTNGGRIYKLSAGTWTRVNTNGNATTGGGGLLAFGGYLYYASNGSLGRTADGSSFTDSYKSFSQTDATIRPMAIFAGKLCIGDGRYLAVLDSDNSTWTPQQLTLDSDLIITSLEVWNDRLWIGTAKGNPGTSDFGLAPESKIYSWDGAEATPEDVVDASVGGISAMIEYKNRLLVWGGQRGNLYEFNGASFTPISTWDTGDQPHVGGTGMYPFAGAVAKMGNTVFFGTSSGTQTSGKPEGGIWALVQKDSSQPVAVVHMYDTSAGSFDALVTAIAAPSSANQTLYFGRVDGSDYGIDTTNDGSGADYSTTSFIETQRMEFPTDNHMLGMRLNMAKPTNGEKIVISYKADDASAYTTLATVDSSNWQSIQYFSEVYARYIKLKFAFTVDNINTKTAWLAGYNLMYRPMKTGFTRETV